MFILAVLAMCRFHLRSSKLTYYFRVVLPCASTAVCILALALAPSLKAARLVSRTSYMSVSNGKLIYP